MVLPSRLLPLFTIAATVPVGLVQCQYIETRETYVQYPATAMDLLLEEVDDIGAPLGLEVVTSLAPQPDGRTSSETWDLLKGIVHRFRNQNQIIHANPHYYITNGLDLGCRELQLDEDTGFETEVEITPTPPQCNGACTNHGRYCVVAEESFDPDADNHRGATLTEETLRRICMVEIYHGSDLRFWEYQEAFDNLRCIKAGDMSECAMRAIDVVPHIEYAPIEDCMHLAGGLEEDGINVRLKQEMDKQTKGLFSYSLTDVPFIRIGGNKYTDGILNVPHVFEFVCANYLQEKGVSPIACDFCGTCRGVRPCLWQLQCDGRPFVASAFTDTLIEEEQDQLQIPQTAATIVPAPQPTFAPTNSPPTAAPVFAEPMESESPEPTNGAVEVEGPGPDDEVNSSPVPLLPTNEAQNEEEQEEEGEEESEEIEQEEEAEFVSFTHHPTAESSIDTSILGGLSDGSSPSALSAQDEGDEYSEEEEHDHQTDHPFLIYCVPVLLAATLLSIYFIASYLHIRYHERQVSSAEAYFNDLMDESYRDNMAVSGRIEDEESDRSMEDITIEDPSVAAPPFASFKVHMVMA